MHKTVIPAILISTILIAGVFAFVPVQKASTVHVQIIAAIEDGNFALAAQLLSQLTGDHALLTNELIDIHDWITGGHAELTGDHEDLSGAHAELSGEHMKLSGDHSLLQSTANELTGDHARMISDHDALTGGHLEITGQHRVQSVAIALDVLNSVVDNGTGSLMITLIDSTNFDPGDHFIATFVLSLEDHLDTISNADAPTVVVQVWDGDQWVDTQVVEPTPGDGGEESTIIVVAGEITGTSAHLRFVIDEGGGAAETEARIDVQGIIEKI